MFETPPNIPAVTRREFGFGASSFALIGLTRMASANAVTPTTSLTLERSLQKALKLIGSSACREAADLLAQGTSGSASVSVHLRRAGITADGAAIIAGALGSLSKVERARLQSFSLSYNEIGDDGAINLVATLPGTIYELGMVACSISDRGGEELLTWAANAKELGMVCVEGNEMSEKMRDRYTRLDKSSPGLTVFV